MKHSAKYNKNRKVIMRMQNNKYALQLSLLQRFNPSGIGLLKMKFIKSYPLQRLFGAVALSCFSLGLYAGTAISDQRLATELQSKGQFSQETLGNIEEAAAKSNEEQHKSSANKSSRNNKIIQENQLEGSSMSDYILQKRRAADQMNITQSSDVAPLNRIVFQEPRENIRVTYPDGVVVEMKH